MKKKLINLISGPYNDSQIRVPIDMTRTLTITAKNRTGRYVSPNGHGSDSKTWSWEDSQVGNQCGNNK